MALIFKNTAAYESSLKKLLSKYPRAKADIQKAVATLIENPETGDLYPGVGNIGARKARFPLRSYNIGKSGGLRLIFFAVNKYIVPIHIYSKRTCSIENKILKKVKENITLVLMELEEEQRQ